MSKRKVSKPKKYVKKTEPIAQTITVCSTPGMPLNKDELRVLIQTLGRFLKAGSGRSGFFSNKKNATDAWKFLKANYRLLDSAASKLLDFKSGSMFDAKNYRWLVSTATRSSSGCAGGPERWWRTDRCVDFDDED